MSEPLLSIVIPTFGRSEPLYRLVAALEAQTLRDFEVTIVDQNPVGFLDAESLAGTGGRLSRVPLRKPNAATARNLGYALSRGRYVLFLDDDLLPDPTYCARALAVLKRSPEVRCLSPIVYWEGGEQEALAHYRRRATGRAMAGTSLFELSMAGSGGIFFEREYFRRAGGFDELLFGYARMSEDAELIERMRRRGLRVWCDANLFLLHDTSWPGGCGLRTRSYRRVRVQAARSSVLRGRIRNGYPFRIGARDLQRAVRYVILSSLGRRDSRMQVLRHPLWHVRLLLRELRRSRKFLDRNGTRHLDPERIDHLAPYDSMREDTD
jgi:GT2 family glycosyltransferase